MFEQKFANFHDIGNVNLNKTCYNLCMLTFCYHVFHVLFYFF